MGRGFNSRTAHHIRRRRPHRLVGQDTGFSFRQHGFKSRWGQSSQAAVAAEFCDGLDCIRRHELFVHGSPCGPVPVPGPQSGSSGSLRGVPPLPSTVGGPQSGRFNKDSPGKDRDFLDLLRWKLLPTHIRHLQNPHNQARAFYPGGVLRSEGSLSHPTALPTPQRCRYPQIPGCRGICDRGGLFVPPEQPHARTYPRQ